MGTPSVIPSQQGFVLLWLLFLVAGLGVGLAAMGTVWHTAAQREKEAELLFVGDQYRRAIESFWKASPQGQERLPKSLDELLEDPRFSHPVRHLRRLYADPMTGKAEWGLLKAADGGIAGVFSLSKAKPFKTDGFPAAYPGFRGKTSVGEWAFVAAGTAGWTRRGRTGEADGAPAQGAVPAAPGGDGPVGAPAEMPVPTPPTQPDPGQADHASRVVVCQAALEKDYQACAQYAQGDAGRLAACTDAMTLRHRACLEGR